MEGFNWIDYTILAVFLFSIMAGLIRGLIREVLSIVTWIAAMYLGVLFASRLAIFFTSSETGRSVITSTTEAVGMDTTQSISTLSLGVSFIGIFIVSLIIGTIISNLVNSSLSMSGIGVVNRLLGGIFGMIRGFLFNLVLIFIAQLTFLVTEPAWAQSKLVPMFHSSVTWLENVIYPGFEKLKNTVGQTFNNAETYMDSFYRG